MNSAKTSLIAVDTPIIPGHCDVAIIGGGPSGLAAATELKRLGVNSVVVLERESQAGGIPRHCGHSPFGMREFKRIYNGSQYARKLVQRALIKGVNLCLNTSVISINAGCELTLSTPSGEHTLIAKKVVLCTGIRETPRAARLISGQRPMGVMTTGALQSMIYLKHKKPFKHPVVIGSELVSFSALLSCQHAGIRPVAMLEENNHITAKFGMQFIAKALRVPLHYNTRIAGILGKRTVRGVEIVKQSGRIETLACDGVIFTGQFVAESSLTRVSHLESDSTTGNPLIDQFGRCSDPDYFVTGNMTHPVETAGYCWHHGIQTALQVFASLQGKLDRYVRRLLIHPNHSTIKYVVPQILSVSENGDFSANNKEKQTLQLRVNKPVKGQLSLQSGNDNLTHININTQPERRITLNIPPLTHKQTKEPLQVNFDAHRR